MMPEVYEYALQPPYWVVRDEQGYWLVPARAAGWDQRTPFVGRHTGLRPVPDGDAGLRLIGWSGE